MRIAIGRRTPSADTRPNPHRFELAPPPRPALHTYAWLPDIATASNSALPVFMKSTPPLPTEPACTSASHRHMTTANPGLHQVELRMQLAMPCHASHHMAVRCRRAAPMQRLSSADRFML
jgi:hypothetical protein